MKNKKDWSKNQHDFNEETRREDERQGRSDRRHLDNRELSKMNIPDKSCYGNPEAMLEKKELSLALRDVVNALSDAEDYTLIVLCFYSEWNLKSIGEVLGISESAVSRRRKRILALMQTELFSKGFFHS